MSIPSHDPHANGPFGDVKNWDTYDFRVPAKYRDPDPQAVNDFIKKQISEKNREDIQRWFR